MMSDPLDIVTAFGNMRQDLKRIVRAIAENDYPKSEVKEIIMQFIAKQRGHSRDVMEHFYLRSGLILADDEGEIDFNLVLEKNVQGYYKVTEWQPSEVSVSFVNENIRFRAVFAYNFDIFIPQNNKPGLFPKEISTFIGQSQVNVWSRPLDVPLALIWYWMNKQYGEPEFSLESTEDNYLTYNIGAYPTDLVRFFFSAGKQAFDILMQQGVLTDETYAIVNGRLSWLKQSSLDLQAQEIQTEKVSNNTPSQTANPSYAEQLVEIRMEDRRRLGIINTTVMPHSIRSWTELLGFKSPGATEPFFERMEKADLIIVEKTPDGSALKLTENARSILRAA